MRFNKFPAVSRALAALVAVGAVGLFSTPAMAIPAFARKYHTSCTTCHTVFPKLTPFGEAFRRNGYRFPGVDSDYWQIKRVVLGQEAYKKLFPKVVWPSSLPAQVPLAAGFNGQIVLHPQTGSSEGQAANGTIFDTSSMVEEGHLWMGGSFDSKNTFFGELTANSEDPIEVEHALLLFNDLLGPKHAVNLELGHGMARLTSFGMHSTYIADGELPMVPVTALYGAQSDSFTINDNYNYFEFHGVLAHRFDYSIGMNSGANVDIRPTENTYAHIGYKLGGMTLDGEGKFKAASNPMRPWEENSFTIDVFGSHSNSRFTDAAGTDRQDTALTVGGQLEGQLGSLQLYAGGYVEQHNHADAGTAVNAFVQYDELSYVLYPWFVPALRVEYVSLTPQGGNAVSTVRIMPGIAMLVRANLKVTVSGDIETASGMPPGGWDPAGGSIAPANATASLGPELENLQIFMMWAF